MLTSAQADQPAAAPTASPPGRTKEWRSFDFAALHASLQLHPYGEPEPPPPVLRKRRHLFYSLMMATSRGDWGWPVQGQGGLLLFLHSGQDWLGSSLTL